MNILPTRYIDFSKHFDKLSKKKREEKKVDESYKSNNDENRKGTVIDVWI